MALQLATPDQELIGLLTRRVRVLSLAQIARTWYADRVDPVRGARRRITDLARAGLVETMTTMAHPELMLEQPELAWHPGDAEPEFGGLSYRLRQRWNQPLQNTLLVLATKGANQRFGGFLGGRRPRRSEVTHDLHLATVFLWYQTQRPAWAKRWQPEQEQYARGGGRGARLPDAIIRDRDRARGRDLIVEFGGAYSKLKLAQFHAALGHLPYQIW